MNTIPLPVATGKAAVLAQLQKELLPLQGLRSAVHGTPIDLGLGPINDSFPQGVFPLGAVHEFIAASAEDTTASTGFIAALLSRLQGSPGVSVWISASRTLFPPALHSFGIDPCKIIFVDLQKEKELLWTMEEALKCGALAAVIGEIPNISFTASRRWQLAVEQSQVTGFLLRRSTRPPATTACVTRWRITQAVSRANDDLPGIGFPAWNVELLKVRNGKPGNWQLQWQEGEFRMIDTAATIIPHPKTKTA